MSVLDQYTFSRSLSVLSSPSLVSLLSCSLCSQPLSTTTTLSSGQCHHAICKDCVSSHPGGVCPVEGCSIPAHTKDYKENRTLGQLAKCLGNIKKLLENKEIENFPSVGGPTESNQKEVVLINVENGDQVSMKDSSPKPPVKENQAAVEKKAASKSVNRKGASAQEKENKGEVATAKLGRGRTRSLKALNKDVSKSEEVPFVKPVEKKNSLEKINPPTGTKDCLSKDDKEVKAIENPPKDDGKKDTSEGFLEIASVLQPIKKPSRLSLPDGKKAKKGRVRAATTSGQPVASLNATLNQSTTTGVSSLEKKNKKGETQLHAACAKGSLETAETLLSQGATPNTQDHAGWTPLHEAATSGRLDLARLLLEAGGRPSVPSKEERVTALHDAVGSGQVKMVKLLVAKGADRDARDSKGNTPRDMAVRVGKEMLDVLENTLVEVLEEDFMETILQPQDINICLGLKVAANLKLVKTLAETAVKLGCRKPSSQLTENMTHLLVEGEEEENNVQLLTALVLGVEIVNTSWLLESGNQGKVMSCLQYRCEGKGEEGAKKGRGRRASKQPGLLAGIHFFLTGGFEPPCMTKVEIQNIVKMAGGKLITREPDPEFIPSQEATVPHHALTSSSIAFTSHVILYMAGGKREPMLKYNMKHVKTLPVTWLVSCITSGCVVDPAGASH